MWWLIEKSAKSFVPSGTLRVILSWVIASLSPCTQRTKLKRWGYLYSRTAVPSYFNFTECNQAENQHWGQRGCGNHDSACAQGLQVFLILSIIARSGTIANLRIARSQHFNSKSLPFLVICHDEIVVKEMEVLCYSFLIKSQTIAHWLSGWGWGWFITKLNNSFIRGWQ